MNRANLTNIKLRKLSPLGIKASGIKNSADISLLNNRLINLANLLSTKV